MKLKSLILASVLGATCAMGQDKATLDLLVSKGLITRSEADGLLETKAKEPREVRAKNAAPKTVTLGGLLHGRYQYVSVDDGASSVPDTNGFIARRVILFIGADFENGFSARIIPEFDTTRSGGNQAALNLAFASYKTEAGTLDVGLRKVNFGLEEYQSPPAVENPVLEYSAATWRLASSAVGSRHLGVFWSGKIKDTGLRYGAAITNSQQDLAAPTGANNEPAVWADIGYDFKAGADTKCAVGLNLGRVGETGGTLADIIAYNPYATVRAGRFTFLGEVLGWIGNGTRGATDANPVGLNLTAAYKATDTLEPVLRVSHFYGDGLRTTVSGVVQGASNTGTTYDNATAVYAGFNWYISGDNVKLQTGYEFTRLGSAPAGAPDADAHALRSQLQLLF